MIELYMSETCPYCIKVRNALERDGIQYVNKDSFRFREELRSLGGKTQVPFLHDPERGVKMYESDDIIAYARQHYGRKK